MYEFSPKENTATGGGGGGGSGGGSSFGSRSGSAASASKMSHDCIGAMHHLLIIF
jgi:hypothetical protein